MKKTKGRAFAAVAATIAALLILLLLAQDLVMPKYASASREGNLIAEYYKEKREHDVLFLGDCEVYENYSPIVLWEKYGITSYIRGSAQQLIWQSYYLLEEMLEKETPAAVVFNVRAMCYDVPQSEAYNRLTLDGMKWSGSKVGAVKASMMDSERFIDYVFPLLRFHSRWSELNGEDIRYLFSREQVGISGYMLRADVKPAAGFPVKRQLASYRFGNIVWEYLDKMTELCKEKGVELILVKSPIEYPYWYEEYDAQVSEYAEENGLKYYNFQNNVGEIGLDMTQDTYDAGLHLNVYGAEKLSSYFGEILSSELTLPDHSGDAELQQLWEDKAELYQEEWQQQLSDLKEYGYLKSLGQTAGD